MTLTLTPEQQSALMPLHLEAASTGGAVMCGIERASFDRLDAGQLVLRARVVTGEEKQGMIAGLAKVRAKKESKPLDQLAVWREKEREALEKLRAKEEAKI